MVATTVAVRSVVLAASSSSSPATAAGIVPITAAAGVLEGTELVRSGAPQAWGEMALAAAVAGLATYACVAVLLRFIQQIGMWPFVVYRLVLGALLWTALT